MTFAEVKPGNQFQFLDGHLTNNYYRKLFQPIQGVFGYNWNAFHESNPSVFIWVDDKQEVKNE